MFDKLFVTNYFYKRDQNIFMKESTQLLSYFICSLIERHNSTCICPLTGFFFLSKQFLYLILHMKQHNIVIDFLKYRLKRVIVYENFISCGVLLLLIDKNLLLQFC